MSSFTSSLGTYGYYLFRKVEHGYYLIRKVESAQDLMKCKIYVPDSSRIWLDDDNMMMIK